MKIILATCYFLALCHTVSTTDPDFDALVTETLQNVDTDKLAWTPCHNSYRYCSTEITNDLRMTFLASLSALFVPLRTSFNLLRPYLSSLMQHVDYPYEKLTLAFCNQSYDQMACFNCPRSGIGCNGADSLRYRKGAWICVDPNGEWPYQYLGWCGSEGQVCKWGACKMLDSPTRRSEQSGA